jgi:hypothetical protein
MGILTDVVNRSSGKSYRISTVEIKSIGAWQTAVFRRCLGPLGPFRPSLVVGGVQEGRARVQHELVESIVRERSRHEWEEAKWAVVAGLARDEIGLDRENDPDIAADADASKSPEVDAFLKDPSIAALRQEERVLSLKLAEQVADDPEAFRRDVGATATDSASESPQGDEGDRALWDMFTGIPNTHDVLIQKSEILCKLVLMGLEDGKFVASTIIDKSPLALSLSQRNVLISSAETAIFS